jgi:DNA-binding SARP family transcriptional activator
VATVEVRLLGTVELVVDGRPVKVGGAKVRALVALLALKSRKVVPAQDLIDAIWGEHPSPAVRDALFYHLGVLRKVLREHDAGAALVTSDPGYKLRADTDLQRFAHHMRAGTVALHRKDFPRAAAELSIALGLWRGPALGDVRRFAFAEAEANVIEELRLTCLEAWVDAELSWGHGEMLLAPLRESLAEYPTRQRLWESAMIALYRTGRTGEA